MLRVLDLFSGIGGFSLGLERTGGFRTIQFVEIEPFCQTVLSKHWPTVPIHGDISSFCGTGLECDVICGGFPCQDISILGQRAGLEGEQSGLWNQVARIIREARPLYVLLENSPSLCVRGMPEILRDLANAGYDTETFGIPAAAIGAPHLRARQWILAYPSSVGDKLQEKTIFSGWDTPEYGDWWASEPSVGRVAHGVPSRVDRLRALGNAIVPQIAEMIGYAILEADKPSPGAIG